MNKISNNAALVIAGLCVILAAVCIFGTCWSILHNEFLKAALFALSGLAFAFSCGNFLNIVRDNEQYDKER